MLKDSDARSEQSEALGGRWPAAGDTPAARADEVAATAAAARGTLMPAAAADRASPPAVVPGIAPRAAPGSATGSRHWGMLLGGMVAGSLLVGGLAALATAPLRPAPAPVVKSLPGGPGLAGAPGLPGTAGPG